MRRRRLALAGPLMALLGGCAAPAARPRVPDIVAVAAWGGTSPPLPAQAQPITRLTLHHQGETWKPGADVQDYLRRLQRWSRQARGWVDIPYHYIVAQDGRAYAARPWQIAGDTNTEYDPRGHLLVMLVGNFEVQEPTPAQWQGTVALVAHLLVQHGLHVEDLATHRDLSAQTLCPGAHLYRRFDELKRAVGVRLAV